LAIREAAGSPQWSIQGLRNLQPEIHDTPPRQARLGVAVQKEDTMVYTVIASPIPESLAEAVTKRLEQGWVLQGGVSIAGNPGSRLYAQAMTYTK